MVLYLNYVRMEIKIISYKLHDIMFRYNEQDINDLEYCILIMMR